MPRRLTVLVFAIAIVALCARLGTLPLLKPDEGRNAEVAREMRASGAWVVPTYDGLPYLDKPAAYFRLVALSMSALGVNATAARLPSALFALGLLGLVYGFSRRAWGPRAAALAVLVVATTPLVVAFARLVIFDMVLAFFVTAAILAADRAEASEAGGARRGWYLVASAAAGAGVLVKGPVGLLIPLLVLVVLHLVERRRDALRRVFAPLNILVFLAVALPWFVALSLRRPDFPYYGLVEESLRRFTTPAFHRTAPFWYYGPVIVAVFFPWSLLLPEAVVRAWRARRRWTHAERLLIVWALVVTVFFSLSQSKLPGYVLTGVVALGMLTARVLDLALETPAGAARRLVLRGTTVLAVAAAAVAVALELALAQPGGLAAALSRLGGGGGGDVARIGAAGPPLLVLFAIVAVVAAAGRLLRDPRFATAAFAVPPLLLLTVAFGGMRAYADAGSGLALARRIPALPPGTELACIECLPNGVPFYLRRTITLVTADGHETTSNYIAFALRRSPVWPPGVVRRTDLATWLARRAHPVYVLAGGAGHAALDSLAARAAGATAPAALAPGWWGALFPAPAARGT